MDATARFARSLSAHKSFSKALSRRSYTRVPANWLIAVTDVVQSRAAIAEGKFKAVNMAGAASISAVMNALGHQDIPYAFGGDGAAMLCDPDQEALVRNALSQTASWVADETGLNLRAALIPVQETRDDGFDVQVAAVGVSDAVTGFAFSGGGIGQAEKRMKAGDHLIDRAGRGNYPDLSGLSCRWLPIERDNMKVVSLIVEPTDGSGNLPARTATAILSLLADENGSIHPVAEEGPEFAWPPKGLDLEARATRGDRPLWQQKLIVSAEGLFGWFLGKTGINAGSFDPARYRRYTALNTDYRKIQDGLRITVCLPEAKIDGLKIYLNRQRERGRIRYGLSEQAQAVLTCFVPSVTADDHLHFLDGAGGGYAEAASRMQ